MKKTTEETKKPEIGDNSEEQERRELAAIADEIHAIDRKDFDSHLKKGELLLKARATCKHGSWYEWLDQEFDCSEDTAENYMAAARLAAKYRTVRDLTRVPLKILYQLGRNLDEPYIGAAIEALAKLSKLGRGRPKRKMISVAEAERAVALVKQRTRHGDLPEATLLALAEYDHCFDHESLRPWALERVEKLKELKPKTEEEAERIIEELKPKKSDDSAEGATSDAEKKPDAEDEESAATLDGPPPPVPPPADNVAPANFALQDFDKAIDTLKRLMTKPCGDFLSTSHEASDLESVKEFIAGVATAINKIDSKAAA